MDLSDLYAMYLHGENIETLSLIGDPEYIKMIETFNNYFNPDDLLENLNNEFRRKKIMVRTLIDVKKNHDAEIEFCGNIKKKRKQVPDNSILDLLNKGYTLSEIAKNLNISHQLVYSRVKKLGYIWYRKSRWVKLSIPNKIIN